MTQFFEVRNLIIATGSEAMRDSKVVDFNLPYIFDSDSIQHREGPHPKKVVIMGSGIIAVEYARAYAENDACEEVILVVRGEILSNFDSCLRKATKDQ